MPSDVPVRRKINAWQAIYAACCITGPVCVLLSVCAFLLCIWGQSSGQWGATGGLLMGMACAAWIVGAIADFQFGAGKELARLKRQEADRDYR